MVLEFKLLSSGQCSLSPRHPKDTMAMQWHKIIFGNFSLELEGQTTSSYQGCISRVSVGKWIGYFPSENSDDREEKKKEKN